MRTLSAPRKSWTGNETDLKAHVTEWMCYYNYQRKHQHLGYQTPWSLYAAATALPEVA
jgi:transposase InsO family protein